jgi:hypothetical protein
MNKLVKRYARAMWLPTTVMLAGLVVFGTLLRQLSPAGKAIGLAALMACYGWLGWAEFRHLQRMDEMRRRIEMEAMVLAFIASTGVTLTLFFADALKLASVPLVAVPMVLVGCYVLAHLWARLRYRYWSL